jgi:hypothetical protein
VVASEAAASREGRRDYSCDGDMERRRVLWSEAGEGEGEVRARVKASAASARGRGGSGAGVVCSIKGSRRSASRGVPPTWRPTCNAKTHTRPTPLHSLALDTRQTPPETPRQIEPAACCDRDAAATATAL